MLDFFKISTHTTTTKQRMVTEIYPKFIIKKSNDLMIRGGDFYAVWCEEQNLWSTDEQTCLQLIDEEIKKEYESYTPKESETVIPKYLWDAESGMIDRWHKYCQKQMRDCYNALDEKIIFSNEKTTKKDYASKHLSYPLEKGTHSAWDKIVSTLYSEEERHKIEWGIGAIVTGDSKTIQKFMVFYGEAGTGKSTILNIIDKLFDGYSSTFDAKALGSANNAFSLEAFKDNPLVAIQHDGDLSRIEDNTRINSLVSHELMTINEKFKATYSNRLNAFLLMGTNKPVKITDAKSGIIRRLIDVSPTGNKIPIKEYRKLMKQIDFELSAIAYHCKEVYLSNPGKYDNYIPILMMGASNDFYNFVEDSYFIFKKENGVSLKSAWEMYKQYCNESNVLHPFSQRVFREELRNYFKEYYDKYEINNSTVRNYYFDFRIDRFEKTLESVEEPVSNKIEFKEQESLFDVLCHDYIAQYASDSGTPLSMWNKVNTCLEDLDTSKLHYVKLPENHIVIDFDIPDENGNKDFDKNLKEASKWPSTYAELSKSGAGIHLHYIYKGDVSRLSSVYDEHIEVKVYKGNSALRRKLTKCNNAPIASINSGLPLKEEAKMINFNSVKSERGLRTLIKRNLNKEIHPSTKSSIDFIFKILNDAYDGDLNYDVSDMRNAILGFAANSTNNSEYCTKLVCKMKFRSDNYSEQISNEEAPIVFFDVEVFPNLFLVNWKFQGEGKSVVRMINPKSTEIEDLLQYRLIGFNNRSYDNHMLYGALMGYTNEQLYKLSGRLISKDKNTSRDAKFGEAYNISYTDVYDFSAKKQSLKKWEIELGITHKELGLPWDEPVPEELWYKVAEYCDNDVIATEKVYDHIQADFIARQIQVVLVKELHGIEACVNDTTNTLSQKIIFGNNRKPQSEFNWRDISQPVGSNRYEEYRRKFGEEYNFRVFNDDGLPEYRDYVPGEQLPEGWSILPFFKGYKFEFGKSTYLDEEIGEGGRVYAKPGMYGNVWDGDIASQHPHSAIFEVIFGPKFTKTFEEIVYARVGIKRKDFTKVEKMLNGVLKPYLNEDQSKDLAQGLKIVINSIYGLTSAHFDNAFRDPHNIDNIVAKRGALFMTLLAREVQKRGYTVCHIKTDSIKIPDYNQDIIDFVTRFGREYGYEFETEAIFDRFCLVNDAVYIARTNNGETFKWTATGTQFQIPYVFKHLFSKEPITFNDMCETKSVKEGAIFLDFNEGLSDVSELEEVKGLRLKYPDWPVKDYEITKKSEHLLEKYVHLKDEVLDEEINKGHDLHFIGRVGQFTPMKDGCGGGILYRIKDGNRYAVTGTKGYRWMESAVIEELGKESDIDKSYYRKLVDDAIDTISSFGNFDWFVSDKPYTSKDFIFTIEPDKLQF